MKAAADTMDVGYRQSKIIYQQHFKDGEKGDESSFPGSTEEEDMDQAATTSA
ncbi:hypothetical protein BGZ96_001273 [Linnemannia gamsii]|uniref:Uncharacterized protein n=1 Tax=Linnemannia gamsii TaxID=64522 RepID=A0ABQ7JNP4_9FUNG|nr:hypothetical protein BGZ96_001273 [Linnemannia gamsii]